MKIERIQFDPIYSEHAGEAIRRQEQNTETADAVSFDKDAQQKREKSGLGYTKEETEEKPAHENEYGSEDDDLPAAIIAPLNQPMPLPSVAAPVKAAAEEPTPAIEYRSINVVV